MENIFSLSPYIVGIVPIIIALVGLCRLIGLPSKVAPVASILFGVVLTYLVPEIVVWQEIVIQGLLAGLLASGLYSGGKATIK